MKKYILSAIGLGAMFLFSSCSDFLEPRNKSNADLDAEKYFMEHPDELVPTAYSTLRSTATHLPLHEQATDLYINPRSASDGVYSEFILNAEDGTVESYYKDLYNTVNKANALIHYAGEKKNIADQGRFIRVLAYYYLTQQFGAVPFVDYYIQDSGRDYPITPLPELYGILLDECTDLYNNSTLDAQNHNGYASKQAVAAIAAKIALAAAWDLDTDLVNAEAGTYNVKSTTRFAEAAAWAEKAINGVQLTMSFEDKWSFKNEKNNPEEIFSVQYDRAGYPGDKTNGGHSLMNEYMSYFGNCIQTGQKGTGSGGTNAMSSKAASLFEKGDQRFAGTFMTTFYNAPTDGTNCIDWGTEGYLAYYNCKAEDLLKKPIGMKFYPSETTVAEAEADIKTLVANGQAIKPKKESDGKYHLGVVEPFAAILSGTVVTIWKFNENGTMPSKTTMEFTEFIKQAGNNGTCVRKWDDPEAGNVTGKQCYRRIPMLHVSEMYLVAAEAYYLSGQETQSLNKINAVRNRAGLASLPSFAAYDAPYTTTMSFTVNALDLILDERARECYAERVRFHDLRRTKQLVRYNIAFNRNIKSVSDMCNPKGEIKWYRPIPNFEINNNFSMSPEDQNPGY